MADFLILTRDGNIATITLNRPEKRNALSDALRRELAGALEEVEGDDSVSVAILTGAGPSFCAGFDLSEFQPGSEAFNDPSVWESGQLMHERLGAFGKPIVAAINGPAHAGGFDIAVQCDVRIASTAASFAHPEIKFGAPTLFTNLSYVIGGGAARDLALSGRRIDAQEALRIGLVSQVTEPEKLLEETNAYARQIAEAPLAALKAVKQAIVRSAPLTMP